MDEITVIRKMSTVGSLDIRWISRCSQSFVDLNTYPNVSSDDVGKPISGGIKHVQRELMIY